MIAITVEVHSIARIEEHATKAFAAGKPSTANPYRLESTAHRIWMLHYDKFERQVKRAAATEAQEKKS
ncbi:MAG: hypothetical protein ABIT83_20220 [Massilia sp.]